MLTNNDQGLTVGSNNFLGSPVIDNNANITTAAKPLTIINFNKTQP